MTTPRLTLNLIPHTMWGKNVRAVVATATWEALRWRFNATGYARTRIEIDFPPEVWAERQVYEEFRQCSTCGDQRRELELHEEWEFDDLHRVQRLSALIPICHRCHLAKHIGNADRLGRFDEAIHHLARVNAWSIEEATDSASRAFRVWRERSRFDYELDLSLLETIIPKSRIHLDWIGTFRSWFGSPLDAVTWAHDVLASDSIVIDTETTGLPSKQARVEIIELAALNTRGKVLFESTFKPSKLIANSDIHGITNRSVRSAPSIAEKWSQICGLFDGKIVISYNARFEREVFLSTSDLYGLPMPNCQWNCAMQAWWTFNRMPYTKLPEGEHRAKGDARAALKLIQTMAAAAGTDFEDE